MSALTACTSTGQGIDCLPFGAILPTKADLKALSNGTIQQILTHNETGKNLGCWGYHKRDL